MRRVTGYLPVLFFPLGGVEYKFRLRSPSCRRLPFQMSLRCTDIHSRVYIVNMSYTETEIHRHTWGNRKKDRNTTSTKRHASITPEIPLAKTCTNHNCPTVGGTYIPPPNQGAGNRCIHTQAILRRLPTPRAVNSAIASEQKGSLRLHPNRRVLYHCVRT